MGVYHGFEKNETATMFFLKKPSLVYIHVIYSEKIQYVITEKTNKRAYKE